MKILVADKIADEGIELLKNEGFEVEVRSGLAKEELDSIISSFVGIIVRSATKVRRDTIDKAINLKVIGRAGVGLDNIDVDYAKKKGIEVLNTPEATSISVAELALGMMFALSRNITRGTISLKQEKWEKKQLKGVELFGKVLGLVGIGRIGTELAKRAQAMGMKVIFYDPFIKNSSYAEKVEYSEVLETSDYISIHTPLTDSTKNLINLEALKKMKQSAFLINCARGGIVNEDDLYIALKNGYIKGAALDVFSKEPPQNLKLIELDNVVLTPHLGAQTKEGQKRAGTGIAEKIISYLKGGS